jgi:hypothetical protein
MGWRARPSAKISTKISDSLIRRSGQARNFIPPAQENGDGANDDQFWKAELLHLITILTLRVAPRSCRGRGILTTLPMQRNIMRGMNRLFVVFSVCWYLAAIPILWPKWSGSLWSQWQAHRIITNAQNADGTFTAYWDEIEESDRGDPIDQSTGAYRVTSRPDLTKSSLKISPVRFLAWQKELDRARAHRPIKLTIFYSTVPPAIYALAWALLWVGRGFKSQ